MQAKKNLPYLVARPYILALKGLALLLLSQGVWASSVQLSLVDQKGNPLKSAVITLTPIAVAPRAQKQTPVSVAQINKEFVPEVSVVLTGTPISFPNQDSIGHHVYSFSKAKTFDLPLYQGTPSEPIIFDTPGLVTLGCNIHDWMRAYVIVVDTPYYQISDEQGVASIDALAPGDYELEVWHSRQRSSFSETITLDASYTRQLVIKTKPQFRSRRTSTKKNRNYND